MTKRTNLSVDVLVVQSDRELRETLVELLDDVGYAVAWAESGADALALLDARVSPRLLLLDLERPDASARELLARDGTSPRTSVVALIPEGTAGAHGGGKQVATRLEKPVTMQALLQTVARLLPPRAPALPPPAPAPRAAARLN